MAMKNIGLNVERKYEFTIERAKLSCFIWEINGEDYLKNDYLLGKSCKRELLAFFKMDSSFTHQKIIK